MRPRTKGLVAEGIGSRSVLLLAAALSGQLLLVPAVSAQDLLANRACETDNDVPHIYSFTQTLRYWTVVGVNVSPGDDKDIWLYDNPQGTGTALAVSVLPTGTTDFVAGDFNHNSAGTYYPKVAQGGAVDYVTEWDAGGSILNPGSPVTVQVGGTSGSCGVVGIWDLQLEVGRQYCFSLTSNGAADIRMSLLKNPTSGPYWASRFMAEFEKAPGETPFQYTATDNDWYGLVVFNNSPGSLSATFTVEFNQGPCEVDELVDRVCETDRGVPRTYSFQQTSNSWAGVAVSHLGGDDKDIDIYDHPEATGVPLVGSYFSQGTDFVVGDFNHAALGAYYPQVTYGGSAVDYTVEWDGDQEQLLPGIPESGSVGAGNPDCGLIRVWDCDLEAGREYAFILTTKGSADVRLALFRNPGPGVPWAGRAQAEFEKTALDPPHLYTAPDTDRYAVVVFNNSHGGDDYTLRMESDECSRLTSASCQTSNLRPGCFSFEHLPASWTAVAVKPAEGDDKDICVYDNPHALGTPLNCSSRLEGTDVLVGDFNHNPPGTYYARVVGGAEGANHVVEWSNGPELLYPATPVSGTVGGASGDCGLVRIFNLPLESGRQHCFTLLEEGAADTGAGRVREGGGGNPVPLHCDQ
jgi:hypothetical protein